MNRPVHNLAPGFYLMDPATCQVVCGPYGNRSTALAGAALNEWTACAILEVVGDVIPWGCPPNPVATGAETAKAADYNLAGMPVERVIDAVERRHARKAAEVDRTSGGQVEPDTPPRVRRHALENAGIPVRDVGELAEPTTE